MTTRKEIQKEISKVVKKIKDGDGVYLLHFSQGEGTEYWGDFMCNMPAHALMGRLQIKGKIIENYLVDAYNNEINKEDKSVRRKKCK